LLGRERRLGAGALLGSLVLIRSEVAVFVLALALERALAKDRRTLLGLLIVPVSYALVGVIYHHDLLWVFHYPPTLMAPTPTADWIDRDGFAEQLGKLWDALLLLSPAILVAALVRPAALRERERTLGLALLLFLGLIRGFPLFGLFNFDASPRYLLVAAPALALVVGRVVDDSLDGRDGGRWTLAVLLGLLACGFVTSQRGPTDLLLPALAISATCVAMIRLARPGLAVATWSLALLASLPIWLPRSRMMPPRDRLVALERVWIELEADAPAPVLTNVMLLSPWLEHRGLLDPKAPIYYLLSPPQQFELDRLLHAEVGQRDAIFEAFDQHFYGRPVVEREPSGWPPGTIVIFKIDGKQSGQLDLPSWRARLDVVVDDDSFLIGRVIADRSPS
jgi:hypothetical protein